VSVERAPHVGVEPHERDLVGGLLGASEGLHLHGVDADGLERIRQRLRIDRLVVAQVDLVAALGPLELLEVGVAFLGQQLARLLGLRLAQHGDRADAQHVVELRLAGRVLVLDDVGVLVARIGQDLADLARVDRPGEFDHQLGAAAEVDAPVQHVPAALEDEGVEREHDDGYEHERDRQADPVPLHADELEGRARLDDLEELLLLILRRHCASRSTRWRAPHPGARPGRRTSSATASKR
jgi:hypothetical protein